MPDFENVNNFRFSNDELCEIFEALGLDARSSICTAIVAVYASQGARVNTSLLYGCLKVLIEHSGRMAIGQTADTVPKPVVDIVPPSQQGLQAPLPTSAQNSRRRQHSKSARHQELNVRYFKHFNNYLDLLAKHIVEMNRKMGRLKMCPQPSANAGENSAKLETLNRTLGKITDTLSNLSKSNRQGRKLTAIIKCVTGLTAEIEKCSQNFEQLSIVLQHEHRGAATTVEPPNTYDEWLRQFNASPHGKEFVADMERTHRKKVDAVRQQLGKDFEEKIEINRRFIRLHYKEKMLEKCRSSFGDALQLSRSQRDNFNEMIDNKLRLVKDLKSDCAQRQTTAAATVTVVDRATIVEPKTTKEFGCGDGFIGWSVTKLSVHKAASVQIAAILPDDPMGNKENTERQQQTRKVTDEPPYSDYAVQYAR